MVSAALIASNIFLALVVIFILILVCVLFSCHIPLKICTKSCNRVVTMCYDQRRDGDRSSSSSGTEHPSHTKSSKKCLSWVPWVLSCGMCCNAFHVKDTPTSKNTNNTRTPTTPTTRSHASYSTNNKRLIPIAEHGEPTSIPLLYIC